MTLQQKERLRNSTLTNSFKYKMYIELEFL